MNTNDIYNDDFQSHKWPETLVNYIDVIANELEQSQTPNAANLAIDIAIALANYGGGRVHYLPKGNRLKIAIRNKIIFDNFNGTNHAQLANKHQLSVAQIYTIIKEQRALHTKRAQARLL